MTPEQLRCLGRLAERGGWLIQSEGTTSAVADIIERRLVDFDEDTGQYSPLKFPNVQPGKHNTECEVRCVALAVMHAVKNFGDHWGKRLACFSDAGAAIGCFSKGRSCSRACNHLCRQVACCVLRVFGEYSAVSPLGRVGAQLR